MRKRKSPEELLQEMMAVQGFEDDNLSDLFTAYAVSPDDGGILADLLEESIGLAGLSQVLDQALYGSPTDEADGPIILGIALESEIPSPVGLYPVDFTTMVLVVGTHGSGKTTLLRNILIQIMVNYS